MIKLMALLFKKPGLTDEEFKSYWKGKHGALAGKIIPELRKYTQNHFLKLPGLKYEGDGFVELWFDDLGGLKNILPGGKQLPRSLCWRMRTNFWIEVRPLDICC